jgi:phosphatidylserine/phosphatidylglycerophosphate/cardiolipin synthase-like enzyme
MDAILKLADRDIQEIAGALRSGRLSPPFSSVAINRIVPGHDEPELLGNLNRFTGSGFTPEQIATVLELLRADRLKRPRIDDLVQVVATGPEITGVANRDTSVVVRDLFACATRSVLVAGYAVYQGQRVFQALADRMLERPDLQVRFFLDIQRGHGDTTTAAELIRRFSERFRRTQWPTDRPYPQVYFDPRSLDSDQLQRASLHAKCVVVDNRDVFVSSANFTEAAHHRNIELGLVFRSEATAASITGFFDGMLRSGLLETIR